MQRQPFSAIPLNNLKLKVIIPVVTDQFLETSEVLLVVLFPTILLSAHLNLVTVPLNGLSGEMNLAGSDINRQISHKGRGTEIFSCFYLSSLM
jgi:hypothetical protein